ncbi:MAG: hypothetical protein HOH84_07700 [Flavobacteriaceae bacterium]|nr:hypothetical protein [Flavobacteriaceae bacterium]
MNNIIPNPIKLIDTEITNKVTLFYLFKFSKTVETSKIIKQEFDNQNIKCLHWFNCQYNFIGEDDFWTNSALLEFESIDHLGKVFIKKIGNSDIQALQVFNLTPKLPPKIIIYLFKLLRPIGYLLDCLIKNEIDYSKLSNSGSKILPNKKQNNRFKNNNSKEKAYMINLLKAYEIAKYKDKNIIKSGREAYYEKYGTVAFRSVILTGGNFTYAGRFIGSPLIEYNAPNDTKGNWQALGIMEYSNPKKLYSLEKMPGYKKSLKHRDAGLERTFNIYSIK